MDLQNDHRFQELDVALLSIAIDPLERQASDAARLGIQVPMLSDGDRTVSKAYGVMRWAMGGEPGHTFVLVGADGRVRWLRDYGAPENGGLMYVPVEQLYSEIQQRLAGG